MKYTKEKIERMKRNFLSKNLTKEDVTIYYDMDNCLALFSIHGYEEEALKQMNSQGFFENLPVLDDGTKVIPVLQALGFKVKILSACIDTDHCKPEKIRWIKKHFPTIKDEDIILCNTGENKAEIIRRLGGDVSKSILIDDYHKNLLQWIDDGGYAIKKTYSAKKRNIDMIKNHVEIFKILYNLKLLNNTN